MKKIIMMMAAVLTLSLASCNSTSKLEANAYQVAYSELNNYFVRNDYNPKRVERQIITSQEQFESVFGAGAVMGANGQPTSVNFKTQYVLAVILPETTRLTSVYPVSVLRNGNNLIFNYKIDKGEKLSYTMVPYTGIVLDRDAVATQIQFIFNEK